MEGFKLGVFHADKGESVLEGEDAEGPLQSYEAPVISDLPVYFPVSVGVEGDELFFQIAEILVFAGCVGDDVEMLRP